MFLFFCVTYLLYPNIGRAVYNGVNVYRELMNPTEYTLSGDSRKITKDAMKEITDTDSVNAVSPQKQTSLTIKNSEEGESLECYQISSDYLKEVYRVNSSSGMKTFYLTPKAYRKITGNSEDMKNDKKEFQSKYQFGDEEKGVAKFVLLENRMFEDEEIAFCEGNSTDFSKDCNQIRAHIIKKDLDGMLVKHIENLGYGIENMEVVRETEYQLDTQFLKIKYQMVIGILCLGFVIMLSRLVKKDLEK